MLFDAINERTLLARNPTGMVVSVFKYRLKDRGRLPEHTRWRMRPHSLTQAADVVAVASPLGGVHGLQSRLQIAVPARDARGTVVHVGPALAPRPTRSTAPRTGTTGRCSRQQ